MGWGADPMEWRDQGIVLGGRSHGENAIILDVLTQTHGRHLGLVRGGASPKRAALVQPGAQLSLIWRARLEDHLGSFTIDPLRTRGAQVFTSKLSLSGLNAACALLAFALPEREPQPQIFDHTERLFDLLGQDDVWPLAYMRWEMHLLQALGFGLDLRACAVCGGANDLSYISPKSGRAVSRAGAGEWADRLLPLPPVMLGQGDGDDKDVTDALGVTGYFLHEKLAPALAQGPIPEARARFLDVVSVRAAHGPD